MYYLNIKNASIIFDSKQKKNLITKKSNVVITNTNNVKKKTNIKKLSTNSSISCIPSFSKNMRNIISSNNISDVDKNKYKIYSRNSNINNNINSSNISQIKQISYNNDIKFKVKQNFIKKMIVQSSQNIKDNNINNTNTGIKIKNIKTKLNNFTNNICTKNNSNIYNKNSILLSDKKHKNSIINDKISISKIEKKLYNKITDNNKVVNNNNYKNKNDNYLFDSLLASIESHSKKINCLNYNEFNKLKLNNELKDIKNIIINKNLCLNKNEKINITDTQLDNNINNCYIDNSIEKTVEFPIYNENKNYILESEHKENIKISEEDNQFELNNITNNSIDIKELDNLKEKFTVKIKKYKIILVKLLGSKVANNLMLDYTKVIQNSKKSISHESYLKLINEYAKQHCPELQEKITEIILFIIYYDNQLGYIDKEIKRRLT